MANKRDPMQSLYEKGCDEFKDESEATDICAYCATKDKLQPALYVCLNCSRYGRLMCGDCNKEHKNMKKFGLTHDVRDLSAPVEERGKTKDIMAGTKPVWFASSEQVKAEAVGIRQKLQDIRDGFKFYTNPAGNINSAREFFLQGMKTCMNFVRHTGKYLDAPKDKAVVMTKQYQEDQIVIASLQADKQELERMAGTKPVWLGSVEQVNDDATVIRKKLQDIRESFKYYSNPVGNINLQSARDFISARNEDLYEFCSTYRRNYLDVQKNKTVEMTKQYQEDQLVIERLRADKQELERKLLETIKAKEKALNRLVEIQPRSNPEITDLSDENRPTKLGEYFKQAYEDEWTDACEFLTEKRKQQLLPDKSAIDMLYNMLKVCHEVCQETWKKQHTAFAEIVNNPTLATPFQSAETHKRQLNKPKMQAQTANLPVLTAVRTSETSTSNKEIGAYSGKLDVPIKEFCKQFAMEMFHHFKPSGIIQAVSTKQKIPDEISQNEHIQKFIIKCFQLCWMMLAQYPPMVMDFTTQPGTPYNQALFEVFATRGANVAYIVWPPVFLHKDGPIICKGYLECIM